MKSFLWIKQDDSIQCGAACLAMICRFYGSNLKFTEVAKELFPDIWMTAENYMEEMVT